MIYNIIPELDRKSDTDLYVQVYQFFKKEIESGQIGANDKLPSIRQMASDLNLSRTTIENAYNQLLLEGYIYSKARSGYYSSDIGDDFPTGKKERKENAEEAPPEENKEFISEDNFNFDTLRKYYTQVLNYQSDKLFTEGLPQGEYELRYEISDYVYNARGVNCNPSRIVIGAGVQVLLGILSVILRDMNLKSVAVEEPGFTEVRHIFKDYYLNINPISITDNGLDVKALDKSKSRVCYVSPTHQYPTGTLMPVTNRMDLLRWAETVNGYIIEDDYDSELRYSGKPVPSLKGLDTAERVIYLGSFSTLLIPSVRISYMILPDKFFDIYKGYKNKYKQTVSKTEQLVLALYIKEGEFERHLRRIRKKYSVKHNLFKKALQNKKNLNIRLEDSNSGVNLPIWIKDNLNITRIVNELNFLGLKVRHIKDNLIIFNFANLPDDKIKEAVDKTEEVLNKQK